MKYSQSESMMIVMNDPAKSFTPYYCEQKADAAEKQREYFLAAAWYHAAAGSSLGHSRAERYEQEAARCEEFANAG